MQGKIIDFEGIDGAGKSTQVDLLLEFFKKSNLKTAYYKFPQYQKTVYGKLIADFLAGKLGNLEDVNSYLISLAFALDRATVRDKINQEKASGTFVVIDRYTASNKAHQAARLKNKEKDEFLEWLDKFEYVENKVPREDVVIFLDMPVEKSLKLMSNRKRDVMENKNTLVSTREVYLKLAKEKHWTIINCVDKENNIKTPFQIHVEVIAALHSRGIF